MNRLLLVAQNELRRIKAEQESASEKIVLVLIDRNGKIKREIEVVF